MFLLVFLSQDAVDWSQYVEGAKSLPSSCTEDYEKQYNKMFVTIKSQRTR